MFHRPLIFVGLIASLASFASTLLAEELDYHVTDPNLKVVRLDSSPDDSFLSVRTDSTGRIFVGGRRTLYAYDLDESGRYLPRKLLYEFPDHIWVNDIEVRGDDLYLVTVSAVYRIPGGRVNRKGLKPERLLWGVPNGHVHQCFHACAWGPEGDLYISMGDPLWYYGDFTRPDHWGHWTMFYKPSAKPVDARRVTGVELPGHSRVDDGKSGGVGNAAAGNRVLQQEPDQAGFQQQWASIPYNGVGAVFRIRPDGTNLRSYARGLRNPCGLCFDRNGNLFTNDNDHEGIPSLYAPGRLMHVTEGSYWSWPRGWMTSKTPDRADIPAMVNDEMGRAVPVLQAYYADSYLPETYRNNLLVARWCRRTVSRFPLEPTGKTFTAKEQVLLEGLDQARPVGICVGRGGRIFVTICYMAQNEGSPTYRSDLAVITRQEDPETMPFAAVDLTQVELAELSNPAHQGDWSRQQAETQEVVRRAELLQLDLTQPDTLPPPFQNILPTGHHERKPFDEMPVGAFEDDPQAAIQQLRQSTASTELAPELIRCLDLAQTPRPQLTAARCRAADASIRMGGVLTAGFRLTIPPVDAELHPDAPLAPHQKEEANIIRYADEEQPIDLRKLGRVGNYTVAEHWKVLQHTDEQECLFGLLLERLGDEHDKIRLQAAHFLSLLNDPRSEPRIALVVTAVQDRRLDVAKLEHVKPLIWMLGPVPDPQGFQQTVHPVETAAIDLAAAVTIGNKAYAWKLTKPTSPDRPLYDFRLLFGPAANASVYSLFRFDSPTPQRMQLLIGSEDGVKVWQNGKLVFENDVVRPLIQLDDVVPLDLQPGSNDILVRVGMKQGLGGQYLHFRHSGDVRFSLPEKPDGLSLAERLKSQPAGSTQPAVDPRFVQYDWRDEIPKGDPVRGRKLFGAESLGCAKCHAATAKQAGGGGPSLTDAGRRFTLPYLVESVLAPSQVISPVFKSTLITTHQGKVFSGLVVSESSDQVQMLLPDTKRISIDQSEIDERKFVDVSAMPVGLVKTPEELRDVIAYLLTNPSE